LPRWRDHVGDPYRPSSHRTDRTNDDGIAQLAALTAPFGYTVIPVNVRGCLHLKTAVTALDDGTVLINPQWVDAEALAPFLHRQVPTFLPADRGEAGGAESDARAMSDGPGHGGAVLSIT
jgi:N-dimethylarginine dimethylaminohydrolase